MKLGITDLSNGVTVVSNSRVTIANTGIYNIQWSAQFTNPTANIHDVTIWLRKNGVDVPGSSGIVAVTAKHGSFDGHILPSWNFLLDAIAGDYYEFVWSTTDTSVYISFQPAGTPPPSTASVVMTVTQQSGIMAGTGITAINSLTGAAQTLTVGTTGTDFAIVDSGVDHKFNLPDASATARGVITTGAQTIAGAKTLSTAPILSSLTASQLLALDASKNIQTLSTTTYPSLTELSYGKGVTSAIQTQLDTRRRLYKEDFTQTTVTGITALSILKSLKIDGGTFKASTQFLADFIITKDTGATPTIGLYLNTTNSLSGATLLGTYLMTTAGRYFNFQRNLIIKGGNIITYSGIGSAITNVGLAFNTNISTALNVANDSYLILSTTNTDIVVTTGCETATIKE